MVAAALLLWFWLKRIQVILLVSFRSLHSVQARMLGDELLWFLFLGVLAPWLFPLRLSSLVHADQLLLLLCSLAFFVSMLSELSCSVLLSLCCWVLGSCVPLFLLWVLSSHAQTCHRCTCAHLLPLFSDLSCAFDHTSNAFALAQVVPKNKVALERSGVPLFLL